MKLSQVNLNQITITINKTKATYILNEDFLNFEYEKEFKGEYYKC